MLLQEASAVPAYLKAGFLGFNKSGKTWTAMLLAIGTRKLFEMDGPIAFFDTEGGCDYVAPIIERETGKKMLRVKSRLFDDLLETGKECEQNNISVLIVDSITHVWREIMNAYLAKLNEMLIAKGKQPRNRFTLQDIMKIKEIWARWPDYYLNAPFHIIICGRAGFEWDMVENDETGMKELTKTGVKMKVESEFGFEPSLLVEMERIQNINGNGPKLVRRATILGDRFGVIDAKVCDNPTFEFFLPHVELLKAGEHSPVKTETGSQPDVDESGDTEWSREKKSRVILCEEIQGLLVERWPGQTADAKKAKADMIFKLFNTRSWTKVESMPSDDLREGLDRLRGEIESKPAKEKEK
jgi:hypothetical protein